MDAILAPPTTLVAYLIEAAATALIVAAAGVYTIVFQHPASPLRALLSDPLGRRVATGCAMALTVATIVYSRWGRRSGAHCNPAVTLTFFRLGKVAPGDLYGYVAAQFAGALAGATVVALCGRRALRSRPSTGLSRFPG